MSSAVAESLKGGSDLTSEQARALCETMLSGALSDEETAEILIRLAKKGETPEELCGFVASLLSHAERVPYDGPTIDTCGTGGSGLVRFNVSTAVAFVLAAGGLCVAKHGNRGSRRQNGSFDLLEVLGLPVELDGPAVATCLTETGLGFIYARRFHPAMRRVAKARQLAARRTIFNLAGPLSNPTRVQTQVVGAATDADAQTIARCLRLLGRQAGFSVTGHSGLDDVDLSGPAVLYGVDDRASTFELDPTTFGLAKVPYGELPGGDAETNADFFLQLLEGTAPRALCDLVCLSAALVFFAARRTADLAQGIEWAKELLTTGAVYEKFAHYRDVATRVHRENERPLIVTGAED